MIADGPSRRVAAEQERPTSVSDDGTPISSTFRSPGATSNESVTIVMPSESSRSCATCTLCIHGGRLSMLKSPRSLVAPIRLEPNTKTVAPTSGVLCTLSNTVPSSEARRLVLSCCVAGGADCANADVPPPSNEAPRTRVGNDRTIFCMFCFDSEDRQEPADSKRSRREAPRPESALYWYAKNGRWLAPRESDSAGRDTPTSTQSPTVLTPSNTLNCR